MNEYRVCASIPRTQIQVSYFKQCHFLCDSTNGLFLIFVGENGGIVVRLEDTLKRPLLHLPCRHHVAEIILSKVFALHDDATSPHLELFKGFKRHWSTIDQKRFSTACDEPTFSSALNRNKKAIRDFAFGQLTLQHPRDDYKELLELVLIFVGEIPPGGIRFHAPGSVSRARWMARAIYSLKVWLFREQFLQLYLSDTTQRSSISGHLGNISIFVCVVYARYWFTCPSGTGAAVNDLRLLHELRQYFHPHISAAALQAFSNHLWYLSEVLIGFAFYDGSITMTERANMVHALGRLGASPPPKRLPASTMPTSQGATVSDFVTRNTRKFFSMLNLSTSFLSKEPSAWEYDAGYSSGKVLVEAIHVTNDIAERGIALLTKYNNVLTFDERQHAGMLRGVEEHRKQHPLR